MSTRISFVVSFVIGKNEARYAALSSAVSPCITTSLIAFADVLVVSKTAEKDTVLSSILWIEGVSLNWGLPAPPSLADASPPVAPNVIFLIQPLQMVCKSRFYSV